MFVVGLAVSPGAVFPGCCAPGSDLRPLGRRPVLPVPMTAKRRGPLCPESNTDRFRIPVYYLYNIPVKHTCVLPVQNTCTYLLNKLSDGSSKKNFGLFLCQIQRETLKHIYESRAKRNHCNSAWGCSTQWRKSMGF